MIKIYSLFVAIIKWFLRILKWTSISVTGVIILFLGITFVGNKWVEHSFYNEASHREWAKTLKEKPIDFWTYPWRGVNRPVDYVDGDKDAPVFISPKGENLFFYYYPDRKELPHSRYTLFYNSRLKKTWAVKDVVHEDNIKWVFNEQYMIYLKYEDIFLRDVIPVLYIYNLKTSLRIKLAESIKPEFSAKYKM